MASLAVAGADFLLAEKRKAVCLRRPRARRSGSGERELRVLRFAWILRIAEADRRHHPVRVLGAEARAHELALRAIRAAPCGVATSTRPASKA